MALGRMTLPWSDIGFLQEGHFLASATASLPFSHLAGYFLRSFRLALAFSGCSSSHAGPHTLSNPDGRRSAWDALSSAKSVRSGRILRSPRAIAKARASIASRLLSLVDNAMIYQEAPHVLRHIESFHLSTDRSVKPRWLNVPLLEGT